MKHDENEKEWLLKKKYQNARWILMMRETWMRIIDGRLHGMKYSIDEWNRRLLILLTQDFESLNPPPSTRADSEGNE